MRYVQPGEPIIEKRLQDNALLHIWSLSIYIILRWGTRISTLAPLVGRTTIMIKRQPYILIITWSRIDGKLHTTSRTVRYIQRKLVAICRAHTESLAKVHVG